MTNFVLIHNPMFGPAMWMPTAQVLAKRGHNIGVPALGPVLAGEGPYYAKLGQTIANTARDMKDGVVLVGIAGGAALSSAAAAASQVPVRAVIFVDPILPHPGRSYFKTLPSELKDSFEAQAQNGRLTIAKDAALRTRVGDERTFKALTQEMVAPPLAVFDEIAPPNDALRGMPIGVLQLSAHAQERHDDAVWMKWKTRQEISADGFPTVTNAERVATALEALTKDVLA